MPLAEITLIEGRPSDMKIALIEKVTDAIVASLGAPIDSVRVVIREVPASHWGVGGKPKG